MQRDSLKSKATRFIRLMFAKSPAGQRKVPADTSKLVGDKNQLRPSQPHLQALVTSSSPWGSSGSCLDPCEGMGLLLKIFIPLLGAALAFYFYSAPEHFDEGKSWGKQAFRAQKGSVYSAQEPGRADRPQVKGQSTGKTHGITLGHSA